jgi:hypothetical protein
VHSCWALQAWPRRQPRWLVAMGSRQGLCRCRCRAAGCVQTENLLKAALLNAPDVAPGAAPPPAQAQLEAQLAVQSAALKGPIADLLALYAAAFRADAAQTDAMARRLVHAVSSAHGTAAADKALRLTEDLTRSLAQSIKRFLSIVTVCLHAALAALRAALSRTHLAHALFATTLFAALASHHLFARCMSCSLCGAALGASLHCCKCIIRSRPTQHTAAHAVPRGRRNAALRAGLHGAAEATAGESAAAERRAAGVGGCCAVAAQRCRHRRVATRAGARGGCVS